MLDKLDLRHAQRFATRQARLIAGELYPGPVLMPRGMLRALDPVLATCLGPALQPREAFHFACEEMLRGRPNGPLLLTLWASATGGEIDHELLRRLLRLMPIPMPDRPATRGELLAHLEPRAQCMAEWALALANRQRPEAVRPATLLGCGLVITRLITDLPKAVSSNQVLLPIEDLKNAGITSADLVAGVRTPAVNQFLSSECSWARQLLDEGLPVCDEVGARMSRGLRAAVLRARELLRRIEDPDRDLFRRPTRLPSRVRLRCAVRAWWPVPAKGPASTPDDDASHKSKQYASSECQPSS
ncbi:MAG: squalene/phytoene synthase family protein [Planctomycetes bacterium]|nr:squalene/phytoene synthase family protein [Planctomycetota bacterium]